MLGRRRRRLGSLLRVVGLARGGDRGGGKVLGFGVAAERADSGELFGSGGRQRPEQRQTRALETSSRLVNSGEPIELTSIFSGW
jgi:hypothetical protein